MSSSRSTPAMPAGSVPRPTETEIKFRLPHGAEASLEAHPSLRVPVAEAPKIRREVTTYFDTPACDLTRNGAGLRLRRLDERRIQTLKLRDGADGPFGRGEWEWSVDGDSPDLGRLAETPVVTLVGSMRGLGPVFTTEVSRTVWTLHLDGAVIEASLDQGVVNTGAAREDICELELELKEGPPATLYRFAVDLHRDIPLLLGTESKSDRGWRLRTGKPRSPEKQVDIALPRDIDAADAFRRLIGATLANLLANQPAAAAGEIEGVHQMRVAIRRLRAVLVLFRPHLEPHAALRFTAELRRLGQILGEARDWDVFCTETLAKAAGDDVPEPWLDLLRVPAESARAAAHRNLVQELEGPALTATALGLAAWAEDPGALNGTSDGGALRRPLADLAPALEGRLERKVLRRGRRIRRRQDDELHALRKAMKKLRYSVEFLAPLHRRKRVKAYLRGCKALQGQLGTINDATVAVALAERLGDDRKAELAPAVAALAGWAKARRTRAQQRLPKAWRSFKNEPLPLDGTPAG